MLGILIRSWFVDLLRIQIPDCLHRALLPYPLIPDIPVAPVQMDQGLPLLLAPPATLLVHHDLVIGLPSL